MDGLGGLAKDAKVKAAGANGKDDLRFRFTRFADIKLDTSPPYLVDGMLPRIGVAIVWGAPKCGKTFWIFDVEMHVALGWAYRGRRVEQGVVLHIACEGVAGLGARKEAWRIARLAEDGDDASIPFFLCNDTALDLIADTDRVIMDIGAQHCGQDRPPIKIITIDTLNRSLVGSESKDEDMTKYLRAAVALAARFQCLVLIIHHCGYDASHPRGHTSLRGGADVDISVKKDAAGRVLTNVETMRDGPDGAQTLSRLVAIDVGVDDNGNPITSCVLEPDDEAIPRTTQPRKKLSAKTRIVLNALVKAIDKAGEPPPASAGDVPHWVRGVQVEVWRGYFYAMSPAADDQEKDNRRKTFQRAREAMQEATPSLITVWNEFVWLNPEKETAA